MGYEVFDNFLDKNDFKVIQDVIMGDFFPWYFNPVKVSGEPYSKNNFQFTHSFYKDNMPTSDYYSLMQPLISKMGIKPLVRIKANLTTITPEKIYYGYHTDQPDLSDNLKTAVFYINNNDGVTSFKNGPEINSVENRLVVFDTKLLHTGTSSTDTNARYLINFNYYV